MNGPGARAGGFAGLGLPVATPALSAEDLALAGEAAWAIPILAAAVLLLWIWRRAPAPRARTKEQAVPVDSSEWLDRAVEMVGLGCCVWETESRKCLYANDRIASVFGMSVAGFMAEPSGPDAPMKRVLAEDRGALRAAYAAACDGRGGSITYRVERYGEVLRLHEVIRPRKDAAGKVACVICATTKITELHRNDSARAEAERMQSLGRLSSGLAHDFNNILAVILGNLELLQEIADPKERHEMVNDALSATSRGRALTQTMLGFAKRAPSRVQAVDLNEVLRDMAPLLRRTIPGNIDLSVVLEDRPLPVLCDRSLADSAVLNLALNARDAMPAGGKLAISTSLYPETHHGHCALLTVEDTGTGIDPAVQARLFEPFVTSKGAPQNSGLGLAMLHSFVRQAGGEVDLTSRPGLGTRFKVYLPVDSETPMEPVEPQARPLPMRPVRILLLEDDDCLRKVIARQLRRAGHWVAAVSDGAEGERAFAEDGPFELLLADMVVPGEVQGLDLAERLLTLHPPLRVLLLSGYARPDTRIQHPFLQKPISRQDLLRAVSKVLAA